MRYKEAGPVDFRRRESMMARVDLFVLVFLATLAVAQDQSLTREVQPPMKFVFSGPVSEADCRELPTPSFDIRASGPRWKTADRLLIDCLPIGDKKASLTLSLTFVITEPSPPTPEYRTYSFRWGNSKNPKLLDPRMGEFTKDHDRCSRFAALFTAKISKDVTSTTEHLRSSPHWSVSCNGDDLWGTSMEVQLLGKYPDSL
jgi:hypothetical protein